jgi:hypothetical protein
MFAKKMLKELLEKGIFDTLSNDYQSFGVIEDTLYIALRKGEDKPVNEREIVSIAKYKGDRLNYVAGSNTKVTIPMIHMEESAVIGHLTFLSDPLSAYVHHILYGASIIHLQRSEESKLDKYSEDILSHIGDNNYNLFCTKEELHSFFLIMAMKKLKGKMSLKILKVKYYLVYSLAVCLMMRLSTRVNLIFSLC